MSLGQRLFELRKAKGLSQEEAAEKLDVTRQTISKWETGQSTPDYDKILPICELYGMTPNMLFSGKDEDSDGKATGDGEETVASGEETGGGFGAAQVTPKESEQEKEAKQKKALGISLGVGVYFVATAWLMLSIAVWNMNPIVASGIFVLICGAATFSIVFVSVKYKRKKTEGEKEQNRLYTQIADILKIIMCVIYFLISFLTEAWHITWILWLVLALLLRILKLIFTLRGEKDEK